MRDRPTILVVDDEATLRSVFADLLAHEGYACITAANAVDALQIIEANVVELDLLISDIRMPGTLNGLELADRVRELQPGAAILLISGYAEDPIMKTVEERGYHILEKPFRHFQLAAAIREELEKKSGEAKPGVGKGKKAGATVIPLKKGRD